MYGAERSATKKAQEKMEVAEMTMFIWMCGVTKVDRIRNERIRGTTNVGEVCKKVQERKLTWYGHAMKREEEYVGRHCNEDRCGGESRKIRPKWKKKPFL